MLKRYWHDTQLTRIFVRARSSGEVAGVRAAIARKFGAAYGLRILSAAELLAYFTTQVRRAFAVIPILAGLVLFVVLLGMADTLAASVFERAHELGTMRALGVGPQYLRRMLLGEGMVIGVLGLGLASVAGLALGLLWVRATFPYLLGWVLEVHVPYVPLLAVAAVTAAICVVAAVVPAERAARLQPAVALRYE